MPIAPEPMTSSDFGNLLRDHRLEIGPDQLAVRLEPGQHARPRAGRDDDVLGLISARAQGRPWAPGSAAASAACSDAPTTTSPGLASFASPQITSTLFFLSRKPTPPLSCADDGARALHDGAPDRSRPCPRS